MQRIQKWLLPSRVFCDTFTVFNYMSLVFTRNLWSDHYQTQYCNSFFKASIPEALTRSPCQLKNHKIKSSESSTIVYPEYGRI